MNVFYTWARHWGVPTAAVQELINLLSVNCNAIGNNNASEKTISAVVRLEASRKGILLWRNNVGVMKDERGVPVRYGLANDSKRVNDALKSSDLIGIRPNGQFVAREVKAAGWRYTGTAREEAQLNFITLVQTYNGDACFTDGEGSL